MDERSRHNEVSLRFSDLLKAVYLGPIREPAAERRFVAVRERALAEAAAQKAAELG